MHPLLPTRFFRGFGLLAVLLVAGCDGLFNPSGPETPGHGPARVLGVVEVTLTVEPSAGKTGRAAAITPISGGMQFQLFSNGSFTHGPRGAGGVRYVYATFRVRNAAPNGTAFNVARRNVTFLAVSTPATLQQTAIGQMGRFDGSAADPAIAQTIVPSGAVMQDAGGGLKARFPDALQVLTEAEVAAIPPVSGVTSIFPYGFVVSNPKSSGNRTLPANPGPSQFDGMVTFAFKVPLQPTAAQDPFTITGLFVVVEDGDTRLTQSLEEQDAAGTAGVETRAGLLSATGLTLLPGGGAATAQAVERLVCSVRTAGPAGAPLAFMFPPVGGGNAVLLPGRLGGAPRLLPTSTAFAALRCGGAFSAPTPTNFTVHGSQSGKRFLTGGYSGGGTTTVRTPTGTFRPGEDVEVTLTTALNISPAVVAKYRTATPPAAAFFTGSSFFPGPTGTNDIEIADFDGNGHLDLAVNGFTSSSVSVLQGTGGGGFQFEAHYGVSQAPYAMEAGDVDGDGKVDLILISRSSGTARVWTGGVTSSPDRHLPFSVGSDPTDAAVGDVNGDGRLDLAVARFGGDAVAIFLGNGSGGFTAAPGSPFAMGDGPHEVRLGDVNGDGRLDVLTSNVNSQNISVRLGNGAGSFSSVAPGSPFAAPGPLYSLELGDVNGDGLLDLATAGATNGLVTILIGDGTGRFQTAPGSPFAVDTGIYSVGLNDLNGDGRLDLTVPTQSAVSRVQYLYVYLGNGAGGFSPAPTPAFAVGSQAFHHAAGDIDEDGRLDLVVANQGSNSLTQLIND